MKDVARPWILVNGEHAPEKDGTLTLVRRYQRAVERAGGLPVVFPWLEDARLVNELLDGVDGVLLTGGDDFDTEALGLGPTHPSATPVPGTKQTLDFVLAEAALARGIPVLGICYGAQLLALAEGGTLIQDLPSERPEAQEHRGGAEHGVRIEPASKLGRLLAVPEVRVVSRHHQAIGTLAGAWEVTGRDEEGLIEAFERPDLPFAVCVQWHPELSPGTPNDRLFDGLVAAARAHRTSRTEAMEGVPR